MTHKIYIAGPMRGKPNYNFPAFDDARNLWDSRGWDVVSPAELDRDVVGFDAMDLPDDYPWHTIPQGFDLKACVRRDLLALLDCQAIYLLKGWRKSVGSIAEWAVAKWLGLAIFYEVATEEDE